MSEPVLITGGAGSVGRILVSRLRHEGRLVLVCLHPTARYHLEILKEVADEFLLVAGGRVARR